MVIVLIHWKIKPDRIDEFRNWWTGQDADIKERGGLMGEFLSEPLPLEKLEEMNVMPKDHKPFGVCDLAPGVDEAPYVPFVNVGVWKDWAEFYAQVGRNFNDAKPMKDFEQYRRTRTILNALNWRVGQWPLPAADHLESGRAA